MRTLVIIGGFFGLAFFVFHGFFWKLFDWKNDLAKLTGLNRGVRQVLNLVLMICFLIFAYISIIHTNELLTTGLGNAMLAGIAVLWFARALMQPLFFEFKSGISIAFFFLFLFGMTLYLIPLISIL